MPRAPLTVRLFPCSRSTLTVDQGALKFVAEQLSGKAPEQMELSSPEGAPLETSLSASDGTAIDCLRDLLKQRAAQRRARHCWEKLTPAGRLAYLQDPEAFPVFFAYYLPEYIKYPFAVFTSVCLPT